MDSPFLHINLTASPGPLNLQEITWRIGIVLIWFLSIDLLETFIEGSDGHSCSFDTNSRSIRNINVLKILGRDLDDR